MVDYVRYFVIALAGRDKMISISVDLRHCSVGSAEDEKVNLREENCCFCLKKITLLWIIDHSSN